METPDFTMKVEGKMQLSAEPLVSVVICAKNEERYIAMAIDSILQQTYLKFELIVVDDYSTDRTAEVVRSFSDSRVRLHSKTSELPGLASSKNVGTELARGEYVAYQDADDLAHPRRLELLVKEAQSGDRPRVVGSWVEKHVGKQCSIMRLPVSHEEIVAGFARHFNRVTFVSGSMLFPREIGLKIPNRTRFRYFEDWDQLCRMGESGLVEFRNVAEPLFIYNIRPKGSKSGGFDWARYNVFERASRMRRRRGQQEWETIEEFEAELTKSLLPNLCWGTVRTILEFKVNLEAKRIFQLAQVDATTCVGATKVAKDLSS